MTIRRLPSTFVVRFFAIVIVTLTVSPFTQPFSPIAAWDLFEVGTHKEVSNKEAKEVATVDGILSRLPADIGRIESITIETGTSINVRQSAPLVLRI